MKQKEREIRIEREIELTLKILNSKLEERRDDVGLVAILGMVRN
jgi:hypothetical protein